MEMTVLSSGSVGNCYIIKSSSGRFCILDCGIKFKNITNHNSFSGFSKLDFVFTSHYH